MSGDLSHIDLTAPAFVMPKNLNEPKIKEDLAVYEDNYEHVKIVKDTEFLNEFRRRANDIEW